jgi:uncharacterized protein YdaU (DUF1376 family)
MEGAMTKKHDFPPYFRLWVDKFLSDHQHVDLDAHEFGVLVVMVCLAWRREDCALPNDVAFLKKSVRARLPGCHGNQINRLVPLVLKQHFVLGDDGLYRNRYLASERDHVAKRYGNGEETARKPQGNGQEKFGKSLKNNNVTSVDKDTDEDKDTDIQKGTDACRSPYGEAALRPRSVSETDLAYGRSRGLSEHDVIARYDAMVSQYAAKGEVIRHPSALLRTFIDRAAAEIAKLRGPMVGARALDDSIQKLRGPMVGARALDDSIHWDGECDDEIPDDETDDEIPF